MLVTRSSPPPVAVDNLGTTKLVLTCDDAPLSTIHSPYYDSTLSRDREKESPL